MRAATPTRLPGAVTPVTPVNAPLVGLAPRVQEWGEPMPGVAQAPQVMYLSAQLPVRAPSPAAWAYPAQVQMQKPPMILSPRHRVQAQASQLEAGYRSEVPKMPRGEDELQHATSGRPLPLARPGDQHRVAPPEVPRERVAATPPVPVPQTRPSNQSFAACPMGAGDISTQVRTLIGEQLRVLEDRLKTEILPQASAVASRTPRQEKPSLQVHGVKEGNEGEGEKSQAGATSRAPLQPVPLAAVLGPTERTAVPTESGSGSEIKELTIGFRRLAEELQLQMGRFERRLDNLEEDVRTLKVKIEQPEEPKGSQVTRSETPNTLSILETRMDEMQESMRSLEEGLRSWQSHTQHLEDRWCQGGGTLSTRSPSPSAIREVKVEPIGSPVKRPHNVRTQNSESPKHLRLPGNGAPPVPISSIPMAMPCSRDKDAMSNGDAGDYPELSAEVGLSLAVPQLGLEEDSPRTGGSTEGCNLDADASLVSASSETFTSSSLAETKTASHPAEKRSENTS